MPTSTSPANSREYLDTLKYNQQHIENIMHKLDDTTLYLTHLQSNYDLVCTKTKGLREACEAMLDEQVGLDLELRLYACCEFIDSQSQEPLTF
jgi:hypothetical protein